MPQTTYPGFVGHDGTAYRQNDDRLVGAGNPPNDPEFARNNPGAGNIPLRRAFVTIGENGEVSEAPEPVKG